MNVFERRQWWSDIYEELFRTIAMTPHELLRPESRDLRDLEVEAAVAGFERLRALALAQRLP